MRYALGTLFAEGISDADYIKETYMKTKSQQLLEAQRHKDIRDIMLDTLEKFRATRNMVQDCCDDLNVSWGTFYKWAKDMDIEVGDYHFASVR